MRVKLLNYTPLDTVDKAIGKCYAKGASETLEKAQKRINNVANVYKHASTIEHLNYSFDIDGVSRALLQELARHRVASYTVKSTRYTLKELRDEEYFKYGSNSMDRASKYVVFTDNFEVNRCIIKNLNILRYLIQDKVPNDVAKYCLPEAYKTSLVWTINARSLQNFLRLRSDKHALWEIRNLARAIYENIPEEHKFIFKECMYE